MRLGCVSIGLGVLQLAAGLACGSRSKPPARDAAKKTAPRPVSVLVSTEPKHRPRLTLGSGVLAPPRPAPQQVGSLRLKAEPCAVLGAVLLGNKATPAVQALEVLGNKLYVIDRQHRLLRFDILSGARCRLKLDPTWGKEGIYASPFKLEKLSSGGGDTLVASSYLGSVVVRRGRIAYPCRAPDQGRVALHPSGKWGLASYAGSDVQRMVYGPKVCTSAPWHLTGLKDDTRRRGPFRMVAALGFLGDRVLVGGVLALKVGGWHRTVVVGFDLQGRRRFQSGALGSGKPVRIYSARDVEACGPGRFCVLDNIANQLTLWSRTGEYQGLASLPQLLGQSTPVVSDFTAHPGGAAFLASMQGSALRKGLIFRLRGLGGKAL